MPIWVWVENGIVVKAEVYVNGENRSVRSIIKKTLKQAEVILEGRSFSHKSGRDWFSTPDSGVACFEFEPQPEYAHA